MDISLALTLPRDEQTVPVARHIVRNAMEQVGVESTCIYDVELALSEACTNVLLHSGPGDQFVVRLDLDERLGVIRVIDVGHGFDSAKLQAENAAPEAERGRGLGLMQALVDRVDFTSRPEAGTIVTLEKVLTLDDKGLLAGHRKQV
ncbi:MAG TPA: ATP-binding protein [Actinomycetes bacterium]|jgi:serine/threonine-protein kinase RsbW|nr:ATP-binding protein [Actinomycetes bacterium]HEV3504354.1 ATP-binding protein [Actinomycetes bacterium]HEX2157327.1 ATP-binding protein [Actinomycetes bacterium]